MSEKQKFSGPLQANLEEMVGWNKDKHSSYPRLKLTIFATGDGHKQEQDAFEQIAKTVEDIVDERNWRIVRGKADSGQRGYFTIDLTALLTMLKSVKDDKSKRATANAWVSNWLRERVKPEWLTTTKNNVITFEYPCRCGMIFKSTKSEKKAKSRWKKHQKRCQYLKELDKGVFSRSKTLLKRLEDDGGKKEKSHHKGKVGKTKRHRSGKSAKNKDTRSRSKTRRPSRDHNKKKKR